MKIVYLASHRPDFISKIKSYTGEEPQIIATEPGGLYSEHSLALAAEADALLVANEPVTEQLLAACPKVKIVQRFGVGYENLDLEAAAKRGIPCCNLAGVNKDAVADHGMALIAALVRNIVPANELTKAVRWGDARHVFASSIELRGKLLGIFGLGNTGHELAKRGRGFGMDVAYNDIREISAEVVESVGARRMEKDEMLEVSDIVSINVNFNPTAAGMIDAEAIGRMKPGGYLVCCARGGVIDEIALRDALNEGRLAGAGIDVYSEEPFPADNPLLSAKNIILTPHMAGVSRESSERNYDWAYENVRRVVERGEPARFVLNGV
ncbi:MAG: NAD(P)-dependent oxidoreductase [SAR324 cluster bacterium]|nr:NAD(P)-dependent oxidoreductase [SAR324 cluster bacterium]MCZ6531539.1 NAD(P)-dependent oxidoreductase [SAR324 cluster bacterium]MCZ6558156.1 NAD(P)-dependent oxidoreductase [SAR324 cluster bacterium]MCZ6626953.1 NAD(P)-dependent oxidoreductase [SAR324 cluster bacterium]MCZ6730901.1 NAD(P)-dependent oxidoreductase [SAR324 cluster bacterium]